MPDRPTGPAREGGVQSLHRALDLLEVAATGADGMAIGDIAARAGVPLATAHRLLRTLVDRGYMRQLPDRRYALGMRLLPLGAATRAAVGVGAERELSALVDELGETANLAVLDGDHVTYVAQVPGRHSMRMFTEVGRRTEVHCTAVGKALLATFDDDHVRGVAGRAGLARHTAATITSTPDLLAEVARVRQRGYALDEGEQEVGVRCVAVAVPASSEHLAVSVSGPEPRMSDAMVARAVPLIQQAARRLSGRG